MDKTVVRQINVIVGIVVHYIIITIINKFNNALISGVFNIIIILKPNKEKLLFSITIIIHTQLQQSQVFQPA